MRIENVINNNIVSAFDDTGRELVLMGRGLGFGGRPGQPVDEKKVEKVFRIKSRDTADQLKELLADMPLERAQISADIISFAKSNLNLKLNRGSTSRMRCCGKSKDFILMSLTLDVMPWSWSKNGSAWNCRRMRRDLSHFIL